jgi:hypothetical protein
MNISEELLDSVFKYTVKTNEEKNVTKLDLSKVQYNETYRTYQFYEKKFPEGFDNIPGFYNVIESIKQHNYDNSPLQEYEKRLP